LYLRPIMMSAIVFQGMTLFIDNRLSAMKWVVFYLITRLYLPSSY
jgi:hypothetical protein